MELTIVEAVSSIGFPVVMCLVMLKWVEKKDSRVYDTLLGLQKTISANTTAIKVLTERVSANEQHKKQG